MKATFLIVTILISLPELLTAQTEQMQAFSQSYEYENSKDYAGAIAQIDEVYDATSYEMSLRLGWLHYLQGDYIKSLRHYKNAVKIKPGSVEAILGSVYPQAAMENWDEVVSSYEAILTIDPKNYTANLKMANIFNYRKDFNQAITYAQVVGNCYPFDYSVNLVLGQINVGLGKIEEAKQYLNRALLYYPESKEVLELVKTL